MTPTLTRSLSTVAAPVDCMSDMAAARTLTDLSDVDATALLRRRPPRDDQKVQVVGIRVCLSQPKQDVLNMSCSPLDDLMISTFQIVRVTSVLSRDLLRPA